MRYMFLVYSKEMPDARPEDREDVARRHGAVMAEATGKGVLLGADPLHPTSSAKTVRTNNGKASILDGPFAETKEQLAGYYMIDCRNLDEALEWAKKIPTGCKGGEGCIEVRPVRDIPKP